MPFKEVLVVDHLSNDVAGGIKSLILGCIGRQDVFMHNQGGRRCTTKLLNPRLKLRSTQVPEAPPEIDDADFWVPQIVEVDVLYPSQDW